MRNLFKTHVNSTALILQKKGDVEIVKVEGQKVDASSGAYVVETAKKFWIGRRIPVGWLTVYVEGNPDPVSERPPIGYDAQTVEVLTGPYIMHVVGAGFQKRFRLKEWQVWALVGVGFVGLVVVGVIWYKRRFG